MQLSYCTFEVKPAATSTLIYGYFVLRDKDGKQIKSYTACSGQPGYQHSTAYKVRGKGMIPPSESYKLYKGYPSSTPGVMDDKGKGWFFPILGKAIDAVGRSAIGVHPDGRFDSTAGCVGIHSDASFWEIHEILMEYFKANNTDYIPFKVIYK